MKINGVEIRDYGQGYEEVPNTEENLKAIERLPKVGEGYTSWVAGQWSQHYVDYKVSEDAVIRVLGGLRTTETEIQLLPDV